LAGPLIVTAELAAADLSRADALRRAHFPPERNHLPAHLTLFHALPPSVEDELRTLLAILANRSAPPARLAGVMDLGGGTALRVDSDALTDIREQIAERFAGCLTAQDAAGWRPHITVQNKVGRAAAQALQASLREEGWPQPLGLRGLELHRYLGGPWEPLGRWRFRG
jgi:hypothetical protein